MENIVNELEKYAKLIVTKGVNIQKGQELVITCPVDCAEFARIISKQAYIVGAKEVVILWGDEKSTKITFEHGEDEIFENVPQHLVDQRMYYQKRKAAFVSVYASDPSLLADVDPKKISLQRKSRGLAFKEFNDSIGANANSWCVVSIPTQEWAEKVFPTSLKSLAVGKLWNAIIKSVRCDKEDPVLEWENHIISLKTKIKFLNNAQFDCLHYKNSIGTDVVIGLPKNHIWSGASEHNRDGVEFVANMPTEEIFTAPDKNRIDGVIVSSKPLCFSGNIIEDFTLQYKGGKLVSYTAKKGEELLKEMVSEDDGASMLGEVALVPYNSPISNMDILFFNTLFDENASCHFAFGSAYPNCIKGGVELNDEQLKEKGLNVSLVHEDFMVGTKDLSITGITAHGQEIDIFVNGDFVI